MRRYIVKYFRFLLNEIDILYLFVFCFNITCLSLRGGGRKAASTKFSGVFVYNFACVRAESEIFLIKQKLVDLTFFRESLSALLSLSSLFLFRTTIY